MRNSITIPMLLLSAVCCGTRAEDVLGPMAVGGPMHDAENRILSPVPEKSGELPVEVGEAGNVHDSAPSNGRGKVLGEVQSVKVFGSADFASRKDIFDDDDPNAGKDVSDLLKQEIGEGEKTEADMMEAMRRSRLALLRRGYYLARIYPIRDGAYNPNEKSLSVSVEEGRFGKVALKFDKSDGTNENHAAEGRWFSSSQLAKRFESIKEGEPFDYSILRARLFDANSHPDLIIDTDISVRTSDEEEGEGANARYVRYADVNLLVREKIPLHMVFEINNYGMEEVEEWQTSLTLQYLNLTKHDDVLTFSPAMSFGGELYSLAGSYMLPHSWWKGGNSTLYGGYSYLDVDDIVPRLDLEGTGYFTGLQHSETLLDTSRHHLAVSAGILWRYIEDQYTAYRKYKLDKRGASILPLSLALSYTARKPDGLGGRNFATVQGLLNVASSGDELDEMWTDAEERYWIFRWQMARLQPIWGQANPANGKNDLHQWMLFSKIEGQYTTDTLIPVEKLSMGGYNCLRGYHSRGYLGDYGVYGTFELRTPILVDTVSSFFTDADGIPIDRLQFLGFADWGWTAFNDLPSGYDDNEFIYSAGIGARVSVTKYTQLKCDVAFPLRDTDWADDDDMEVYVSVQTQF